MLIFATLLILEAPFLYGQDGINFELDQPSELVFDTGQEDCLVAFSQRDGLLTLTVNLFEDLMWSDAITVFSESTREFLEIGYSLVSRTRLSHEELMRANATDGARFHYSKQDGEVNEHIIMFPIVRDHLTLVLTFYLPRWRQDKERLNTVKRIVASFRFLPSGCPSADIIPPPPPLK